MRRNRLKWIKVTDADTAGNGFTINAPNVFRRVLAVIMEIAGSTAGEEVVCRFLQKDGNVNATIAETLTPGVTATALSRASFVLGGTSTASGSGYAAGPLPDIWFGPDLPVALKPDSFSGANFTNMRVLVEECDLSEG